MPENDYLWDPGARPDPEIERLEKALAPLRYQPAPFAAPSAERTGRRRWFRPAAGLAAAAVLAAVVAGSVARSLDAPWTVRRMQGVVMAGGQPVSDTPGGDVLREQEWVETGSGGAARIKVGRIGRAELGPGSRARLVRAEGAEHRMAMDRGTLHARIWAPPRFFLVETPSALAIDLGCIYTLSLDENGAGVLRVESGEVELVEGSRRAVVLAGNEATLTPGAGPGLPYPVRAGPAFRRALRGYEAREDAEALQVLLAASDAGTTITLWHLLQRVAPAERRLVYARLVQLAPPPAGVTDSAALELDPRAMLRWRRSLERSWTTESVPVWKRTWRRAWSYVMHR
ncbi:MAG TPA: hypothetical protein VGB24_16775 [Longimicrobium sp.]|jgi:hypothetical protein|uniref:hypothetical protein n=1 Tax=Longimicrobium sp. TaxID=2029185 RepID=UPI002ED7D326